MGTCRIPGCKTHWGCVCLDSVTVPSHPKYLTAVIEYPITNPGFDLVCPPTIWNQNFFASCTIGYMGFVGQEADCSPSAKGSSLTKRGAVLGARYHRAPRSPFRISLNVDFPFALKPLAKPLPAGRDVVSSLSGCGEGQKVLLEGC